MSGKAPAATCLINTTALLHFHLFSPLQIRRCWESLTGFLLSASSGSCVITTERDGSPRPAVGRHRRGAPPGHRPRPPPQAGRAPRRRQDQRSVRRACSVVRPTVAGVGRRGDAGEGDSQHHDQAPRGVPGVAEERGRHATGISRRVHTAHIAVRRRRWSLQKEIIFRCI